MITLLQTYREEIDKEEMCVEYLENLPDSVPVPEISEQMDISDAPPLCESRSGDETEEVINLPPDL